MWGGIPVGACGTNAAAAMAFDVVSSFAVGAYQYNATHVYLCSGDTMLQCESNLATTWTASPSEYCARMIYADGSGSAKTTAHDLCRSPVGLTPSACADARVLLLLRRLVAGQLILIACHAACRLRRSRHGFKTVHLI